jgi:hypothetical protein
MDQEPDPNTVQWGDRWLVNHVPLAVASVPLFSATIATGWPAPWWPKFFIGCAFFGTTLGCVLVAARRRVAHADGGTA